MLPPPPFPDKNVIKKRIQQGEEAPPALVLPILAPAGIPNPDSPSWVLLRCHPGFLSLTPNPTAAGMSISGQPLLGPALVSPWIPVTSPAGIPSLESPSWKLLLCCHSESPSLTPNPTAAGISILESRTAHPGSSCSGVTPNPRPSAPRIPFSRWVSAPIPLSPGSASRTRGRDVTPGMSPAGPRNVSLGRFGPLFPFFLGNSKGGAAPWERSVPTKGHPRCPQVLLLGPRRDSAPPSPLSSSFTRPRPEPGSCGAQRRGQGCPLTFWSVIRAQSGPKSCPRRWEREVRGGSGATSPRGQSVTQGTIGHPEWWQHPAAAAGEKQENSG